MSALAPTLPGATVLDLFAGSGALGLECLSRGAAGVVFVERARGALGALRENVALLECGHRVQVVQGDALRFVRGLQEGAFDLALADPPYGRGMALELVERFVSAPFAGELWVEHRATDVLPELPGIRQRRYGDTVLSTLSAPDAGSSLEDP